LYQSFTVLDVWKSSRRLKTKVWKLVKGFPFEEKFRLSDQIIRSSISIGALIAEGHGKFTYKDQINYCIMARGSISETLNHLIDALDAEYITKEELALFKIDIDETGKLLNGYISHLRKKLQK
jgi:four helix bundle protein